MNKDMSFAAILKAFRIEHGYTQYDLATYLGYAEDTITAWECGRRTPAGEDFSRLAKLLEVDEQDLAEVIHKARLEAYLRKVHRTSVSLSHEPENKDMKRRQAFQLFGIAGAAALLDWEKGLLKLQGLMLDSLEDGTRSHWELYFTSSNAVAEDGLLDLIHMLEQLADAGVGDQKRIDLMMAQNYQLAGTLARDNFRYSLAKKYFLEAYRLATCCQSPDLAATAVARYGLVFLRQERFEEALMIYQNALDLSEHTQAHAKAYIHSELAEALARNKQKSACYRELDRAQEFLDRARAIPVEEDFTHVRLTAQSLEDTRGECYVLLGEPHKGLDCLHSALQRLDPTMSRRRCRLLMQQAEAHLAVNDPVECVRCTVEGLQLALTLQSKGNINWATEIHTKLERSEWRNEQIVAELGTLLASLEQANDDDTESN
jgi:transcriptional regulator with XRE-family HTH domain